MGVYIKGMEIPKSCANCEWSRLSKMDLGMSCFCTLAKKSGSLEIAKNNRMDFCPIVPVPPHGDLIDLDVLLDEQVPATLFPCGLDGKLEVHTNAVAVGDIMYAPTVIPAEPEKENEQ